MYTSIILCKVQPYIQGYFCQFVLIKEILSAGTLLIFELNCQKIHPSLQCSVRSSVPQILGFNAPV